MWAQGITLSVTGVPTGERKHIQRLVEEGGGT
jgi:hypothetical protein